MPPASAPGSRRQLKQRFLRTDVSQRRRPELREDLVFRFGTFGFLPLAARVVESQAPGANVPDRLSWTAEQEGGMCIVVSLVRRR